MSEQNDAPKVKGTVIIRGSVWYRANRDLFPFDMEKVEEQRAYTCHTAEGFMKFIMKDDGDESRFRNYEAMLLRSKDGDGGKDMMCCLGIHALQCGAQAEELRGASLPAEVSKEVLDRIAACYPWLPIASRYKKVPVVNDDLAHKAADINDDWSLDDEEKIERLRPIFRQKGWLIDWRPDE